MLIRLVFFFVWLVKPEKKRIETKSLCFNMKPIFVTSIFILNGHTIKSLIHLDILSKCVQITEEKKINQTSQCWFSFPFFFFYWKWQRKHSFFSFESKTFWVCTFVRFLVNWWLFSVYFFLSFHSHFFPLLLSFRFHLLKIEMPTPFGFRGW